MTYIHIYIYIYIHMYMPLTPRHPISGGHSHHPKGSFALTHWARQELLRRTADGAYLREYLSTGYREHATSAPAELGGEPHNVSRNRARTQVLLQARKLHVYGSGAFGAFWTQPTEPTRAWVKEGRSLRPRRATAPGGTKTKTRIKLHPEKHCLKDGDRVDNSAND